MLADAQPGIPVQAVTLYLKSFFVLINSSLSFGILSIIYMITLRKTSEVARDLKWSPMKQNMTSPKYTTNWYHLPKVN